jgi:hypothetical protein
MMELQAQNFKNMKRRLKFQLQQWNFELKISKCCGSFEVKFQKHEEKTNISSSIATMKFQA